MTELDIKNKITQIPEIQIFLDGYNMNSKLTSQKYCIDICLFCNILNVNNFNQFYSISLDDISKYKEFAINNKWSASTFNGRVRSLKIFYKWLNKYFKINNELINDIQFIRIQNNIHYTPTKEECELLINTIRKHTQKKRTYLLTKLFLETGFRKSEMFNIKISDLDEEKSSIRVRGKNNKIVLQPITSEIMSELREYIEKERKTAMATYISLGGIEQSWLWVSCIGNKCKITKKNMNNGNKCDPNSYYNALKKYAKKAGLKNYRNITLHGLRRRGVSSIYEETGDVLIASKFARHASTDITVKSYIDFDRERLRDAVNKVSQKNRQNSIEEIESKINLLQNEILKLKDN